MAYADEIHPCTIWSSPQGKWYALPCRPHLIESASADLPLGKGSTAAEALADLAHQLLEAES